MSETHLGKYRLLRLLATGGMGEVFLARQEGPAGFAKPAVVKRVLAHLAREPGFVEMFLDEARLAALLTHPNVIQIFELGEDQGTYFIAMEYLHGKSLRAIRQQAAAQKVPVQPGFVAAVMSQALLGLHYAHHATSESGESLNLVHRDVSPDNVMVGFNGLVKVLDFGIAKATTVITTTRTGTVKGKFAYMAPEQLLAEPLDGRADVYAVGVVMYELLANVRPFVAPTEAALVNLVLNSPTPQLTEKAPEVPAELAAIVMKALAKDRTQRWSTAEELSRALDQWVRATDDRWTQPSTISTYLGALFGPGSADSPPLVTPTGAKLVPPRSSPPRHLAPMPPLASDGISHEVDLAPTRTGTPLSNLSKLERPPRSLKQYWWLGLVIGLPLAALAAVFALRAPEPQPGGGETHHPGVAAADAGAAPEADAGGALAALPARDAGHELALAQEPDAGAEGHPDAGTKTVLAAHGKGKVDFRITPWGEVFEGPKSLGITPLPAVELSAGAHTFTIKNPDLKASRTVRVTVVPGKTQVLRLDLLD